MKKNTPTLEAPVAPSTPEIVISEVDNNSFYTFKNVTVVQVVNYDEVHIAAETPEAARAAIAALLHSDAFNNASDPKIVSTDLVDAKEYETVIDVRRVNGYIQYFTALPE